MQQTEQIFRLPRVAAYAEVVCLVAQTAHTKEVVPGLLALADRLDALADQQEARNVA